MSYHKVLGIQSNATVIEIKQAYRALALQFHPDVTNNDVIKTEKFKRIQIAYDVLINKTTGNSRSMDDMYASAASSSRQHNYNFYSNRRSKASSGNIPKQPVDPAKFNVDAWNAWHYGDGVTIVQSSVKQTNSYMDLKGNNDQQYFRKRMGQQQRYRDDDNSNNTSSSSGSGISTSTSSRGRNNDDGCIVV